MHNFSRRNAIYLGLLIATSPFVASMPSVAADEVPLAIQGYDPVAYFTVGSPVRGLPEIEYAWDEHRYRFARAEHRELFKSDPVRYAPQFASFCATAMARGELEEGKPEFWLIIDARLYLFGRPSGSDLFQRGHVENIKKANQNRWLIERR
jgi:hypothetical protein